MTGFVATFALALSLSPGQSEGVLLRWKLKEGDTFYAKTVTTMEQTVTAMGRDIEQKQEQTTVHRYKVLKASDKSYTVEQTVLQSITESNLAPGGLGDLDKKMKGATFTVELDANLKVTKIAGVQELVKKLGEDNPLLKQVLSNMLNDNLMKKGIEDVFRCGPDRAVKVGDSWKRDESIPLGPLGELSMKQEYKLAKSKDAIEEITYGGEAKYGPPKDAAAGGGGLPFTVAKADLKTDKFSGTLLFDSKAGRTKENKVEMNLSGTMSVKVGELEVDMDLKQKLVTKTTLTEKSPVDD
ncbi:MAG: hypothetical protein JNK93_17155 [Planctomycetia bacterium]|nr:hypothetical protein [Planctomycetia bacterium]